MRRPRRATGAKPASRHPRSRRRCARIRIRPESRSARSARDDVQGRVRAAPSGSPISSASVGRPRLRVLTSVRCCARRWSTGWPSALNVISLRPGRDFEIVTVSFDPRDTPASAAKEKAHYIERYQRPGRPTPLALPDRRRSVDPGADRGSRLPLRVGCADQPVRAPEQRHRAHARRPAGALSVRHRVRPARPAAGHRRGVNRQGRRSPADALLLYCYHYDPMTGRYGVRRSLRADAPSPATATALALGAFIFVMLRRERQPRCTLAP
mgnify:CR=1 FL=1